MGATGDGAGFGGRGGFSVPVETPARSDFNLPFFYIVLFKPELTESDMDRLSQRLWRIDGFSGDRGYGDFGIWYVGGEDLCNKLTVDFPFVQAGMILNEAVSKDIPAYYDPESIRRYFETPCGESTWDLFPKAVSWEHLFFVDQPAPYIVSRITRHEESKKTPLLGISIRPDETTRRVSHLWDIRADIIVAVTRAVARLDNNVDLYKEQLRSLKFERQKWQLIVALLKTGSGMVRTKRNFGSKELLHVRQELGVTLNQALAPHGLTSGLLRKDYTESDALHELFIAERELNIALKKRPALLPPLSDRVERLVKQPRTVTTEKSNLSYPRFR